MTEDEIKERAQRVLKCERCMGPIGYMATMLLLASETLEVGRIPDGDPSHELMARTAIQAVKFAVDLSVADIRATMHEKFIPESKKSEIDPDGRNWLSWMSALAESIRMITQKCGCADKS